MDKKNLKTRIMRASGKGCVAAVFAERSSMACVPAFMESCEAAGIKPAAGVRMMVEAAGVRGELLFLVKDRAGYREICHLLSDTLAKDDPVVTMEMIGQGHVIIVHEKNGLFDKILMRNKEIKKEIRELKRKMKGLPSAGGESWKDAVGEYNRLQEEDAVVRMSLKQVPASDSYQLDFSVRHMMHCPSMGIFILKLMKKEERYARLQKVTAFPVSVRSGKQMG